MQEAFVYIWENVTNGNKYIGYHKGSLDDGYVSSTSSERFWNDFKDPSIEWKRHIVFQGTSEECLKHEQQLLREVNLRSDEYYNNARGAEIIFTEEVRNKIRQHHMGKSSGMLGKNHSDETKQKQSEALKGRIFDDEHKQKLRKPNKDASNKKGPKSEQHKINMRKPKEKLECIHCHKMVAPNMLNRWHNDNCKDKL